MSAAGSSLKRWALSMSQGLSQGLGGPGLCLAMQAHVPRLAPAVQPASLLASALRAGRAVSPSGVQA